MAKKRSAKSHGTASHSISPSGNHLDPKEDPSLIKQSELATLEKLNQAEAEADTGFQTFLEYLETLPDVGYVRRHKSSLLHLWVYYRWGSQTEQEEPLKSREEIDAGFGYRSKSNPDNWSYRSESQPPPDFDSVEDLPF